MFHFHAMALQKISSCRNRSKEIVNDKGFLQGRCILPYLKLSALNLQFVAVASPCLRLSTVTWATEAMDAKASLETPWC